MRNPGLQVFDQMLIELFEAIGNLNLGNPLLEVLLLLDLRSSLAFILKDSLL